MPDCAKLILPDAPCDLKGAVKAWDEPVVLETYEPEPADGNPMFLESRVYQGSSGKVYPLPFIERIAERSQRREWRALHIENDTVRVMILPELGGRIHVGLDKTNGYDFFYRQNVIKPALVGLAGPWISGGVEFNWPQHHRPATYMPVETHIEHHADGSATIWCSDHDPFERMKAAHGVCLHPGKALLEVKVRLYNRTCFTQTFLWWANAATRVHELYQSFFPPDVHFVADHARRATSTYPFCSGTYYGIDYAKRAREGAGADEMPPSFVPPGTYAPNDLRWYANIPVPTSYMALGSEADFFGGYDHRRRAGVIHVAEHHIAPGKKQWTWGNHEFGYSWDRQLTDADGPYIELMAGVYTDNQPDFSFLAPGETKTFSQYWYPIQEIGIAHAANVRAACHVNALGNGRIQVGLYATEEMHGARATVSAGDGDGAKESSEWVGDVGPGRPAQIDLQLPVAAETYRVTVSDGEGKEVLRYSTSPGERVSAPPEPAKEPPPPAAVEAIEELFLIGRHLDQYRHATRDPIDYWTESLRRDPGESRCHEAIGLRRLRSGEFAEAERHFLAAAARLTVYNANPPSGSVFYHLGLAQRLLGKDKEAYDAFYKSTWNFAFGSAAHYALAEMDTKRGRFDNALEHLKRGLRTNVDDLRAHNLQAVLLKKLGRETEAARVVAENLALDPTDVWAQYLAAGTLPRDNQMLLDLAYDYARAGLFCEAIWICERANFAVEDGSVPMVCYTLACFCDRHGQAAESSGWLTKAREASPRYCFPSRIDEMLVLEWALERNSNDERANYYLGNLLYDKRRYQEAIEVWEMSLSGGRRLPTAWRNLGIAYFNVLGNVEAARKAFDAAFELDPSDSRVFFERDQLWKRIGVSQAARRREMELHRELVAVRDDLSIELIALLNQNGEHEQALRLLSSRSFRPWEGGEGLVLEQHVRTHIALGRKALLRNDGELALRHFQAALQNPANLGEASHPLANRSNIYFWLGSAYRRLGSSAEAERWWQKAAASEGDFQEMAVREFSAMSFYRAFAFQQLGTEHQAEELLNQLRAYAHDLELREPWIDYFATSLPNMLLFREDLRLRQQLQARFLKAQALLGLGEIEDARRILAEILADNPSHAAASDLLAELECLGQLGLLRAAVVNEKASRD